MVFVYEIRVSDKPLGIPYFRSPDDPTSHDYVNLREHPEQIDLLPELSDSPPFRDFIRALNAPSSPFQTFGCEKKQEPFSNEQLPDFHTAFGSYTDIAFVDVSLAKSQIPYLTLIEKYRSFGHTSIPHPAVHVGFDLRITGNIHTDQRWWTLEFCNRGIGRSEKEAAHGWAEGLRCFQRFLLESPEALGFIKSLKA